MLSAEEFVERCKLFYRTEGLDPGNPLYGDWHKAHHPMPACKGGESWIWLAKEHHAIHGVLQSEELGYPCIWNWEKNYLSGEYLELFNKWFKIKCAEAGSIGGATNSKENKSKAGKISVQKRRDNGSLLPQCSKAGKIGGKKTASQKWRCTITGFIANAGNLTLYQKARNIDISNRERLQ